jgi:hypothetical protein
MRQLHQKLKDKGWEDHEIHRAVSIIKYGKSNQENFRFHNHHKKLAYWAAFFGTIISNFILTAMLFPFLLVLKYSVAHIAIILFALGFGYIYNFFLKDIYFSDYTHHVVAWLIIPPIAFFNMYLLTKLTNIYIDYMKIQQVQYDQFILLILYFMGFIIPYIYSHTPILLERLFLKKDL